MKKIIFITIDTIVSKENNNPYYTNIPNFVDKALINILKISDNEEFEIVFLIDKHTTRLEYNIQKTNETENTHINIISIVLEIIKAIGIKFYDYYYDITESEKDTKIDFENDSINIHNLQKIYDLNYSYLITSQPLLLETNTIPSVKKIFFTDQYSENIDTTCSWDNIYKYLIQQPRKISIHKENKDIDITITLNLDGAGKTNINSGIGFLDFLLEQFGEYSSCDLYISIIGNLNVDEHSTVESTALVLGEAFKKALGKVNNNHYGFMLPVNDCLAQVAIEFGTSPWLVWDTEFRREKIGQMPTELFFYFFKCFSDASDCNLNIKAEGHNEHHKIESIIKAFGKAIKMAIDKHSNPDTFIINEIPKPVKEKKITFKNNIKNN
ncbi:MAG: hypothetical protein QM536_07560 [Chitinophagaceae bacterium]|nr:hypothetical protein [Chitinophagaceae bacterium]